MFIAEFLEDSQGLDMLRVSYWVVKRQSARGLSYEPFLHLDPFNDPYNPCMTHVVQ